MRVCNIFKSWHICKRCLGAAIHTICHMKYTSGIPVLCAPWYCCRSPYNPNKLQLRGRTFRMWDTGTYALPFDNNANGSYFWVPWKLQNILICMCLGVNSNSICISEGLNENSVCIKAVCLKILSNDVPIKILMWIQYISVWLSWFDIHHEKTFVLVGSIIHRMSCLFQCWTL